MKQMWNRLLRGLMFALAFLPLLSLLGKATNVHFAMMPIWFGGQTLLVSLLALLPAFVGSYTETEVIRYEGGSHHSDEPNLDRDTRHVTVKSGYRIPVRLPAYILFLAATLFAPLLLPSSMFQGGSMGYRILFLVALLLTELVSMYTITIETCPWTELPGIAIGFLIYLSVSLYLQFSKAENGSLNTLVGVCALAYVFFGGLCMNRQSINFNGGTGGKNVPLGILRRNRRIVIGVTVFTGLISFVTPIRNAASWLLQKFLWVLKWVAWLLRGGKEAEEGNVEMLLQGEESQYLQAEVSDEVYGVTNDKFERILTYAFLIFAACGVLWMLFDALLRLAKKLNALMDKFAAGVNEGYYDEKTVIDPEEAKNKVRSTLRERLKKLFARETPWEQLDGREKARRLVKELYKKRGLRVNRIKVLTAREAVPQMGLKGDTALRAVDAYEQARYSSLEVNAESMDTLRKEIKP